MKNQTELKPCPFCGGEALYYDKPIPTVECKACLAKITGAKFRIPPVNYPDYLVMLWNRRTGENNDERS